MGWVRDRSKWWMEERRRLRHSVLLAASAMTLLVVVGTISMHHLEGWDWIPSFYFSVTTLATVAYGDLYPTTDASRLFVAFYVIAGVTTAFSAMTIVGRTYLEYIQRRLLKDRRTATHSTHGLHHSASDRQSSP